ncbi:MAG: S8 family serine peptidase [Clostridia bacterium]|nr:S8 family serine peptidase [Clostridia bacterium]
MKRKVLCALLSASVLFSSMSGVYAASTGNAGPIKERDYKIQLKSATIQKNRAQAVQANYPGVNYKKGETVPYLVVFEGPLIQPVKKEVTTLGGKIVDYIPDFCFVTLMTPETAEKVRNIQAVLDIVEYLPEFKIDPELKAKLDEGQSSDNVEIVVSTFEDDKNLVNEDIVKNNGSILYNGSKSKVLRLKKKDVKALTGLKNVRFMELKREFKYLNDVARDMVFGSTSPWDSGYWDGNGEIVGICDSGIDTGVNDSSMHPDLQGKIKDIIDLSKDSAADDSPNSYGHGTHVTGSVVGSGAASGGKFKGVAPGAKVVFQANGNKAGSMIGVPDNLNDLFDQAYKLGARIHSNSWGGSNNGSYTADCFELDDFVWKHRDMTILFAAGNDGDGPNQTGTIINPSAAKNCITVGNAQSYRPIFNVDTQYDSLDPHQIASRSSRGNTADGRIKPDIVSPGTHIVSVKSSLIEEPYKPYYTNSNYQIMSGTSMATPITAGMVAVLRQYLRETYQHNASASLIKALLINGAGDMGYGIPSREAGWGKTNLYQSSINLHSQQRFFDDESSEIAEGQTKTYSLNVSSSSMPLKLTLVWTDLPAPADAAKALINNLDLKVTSPSGTVYNGNDFTAPYNSEADSVNNVESVIIPNPETGAYTVEVKGTSILSGPQYYSLVGTHDFLQVPQNLMFQYGPNTLTLQWDAVPGAVSYDVEIDGTTVVNCTGTSYVHSGLINDVEHTYRVRARTANQTGSYSYKIKGALISDLITPQNVTISNVSQSGFNATWDAVPLAGYYMVNLNGKMYCTKDPNFSVNNLMSNKSYTFSVRAENENKTSSWTEVRSVITLDNGLSQKKDLLSSKANFGMTESGGKIYAAGGYNGSSYLKTLECYDPGNNTWTAKSSMVYARSGPGVSSYNNILYVVGGYNGTSHLKKLEAYNAFTNTWQTLADMPTARKDAAAIAVNGKLYVIGGSSSTTKLNKVEVYNTISNTWSALSSMPTARSGLAVTVIANKIYAFGGYGANGEVNTAEVYDIATNSWTALSTGMPVAKGGIGATTINSHAVIVADSIYEYYVPTNQWIVRANLPSKTVIHSAVASYNGKAYIGGGLDDTSYSKSFLEFNSSQDAWSEGINMSYSRYDFGAAELNGKIYTVGGKKVYHRASDLYFTEYTTDDFEKYDPATGERTSLATMSYVRDGVRLAALNGKLYAIGGNCSSEHSYSIVEEYDPLTNQWTKKADMQTGREDFGVAVYNNKIYVIGGRSILGNEVWSVEEFDPIQNNWTYKAPLNTGRTELGTAVVNGKIYAIGGKNGYGYSNVVEEYDPAANVWTYKNNMPEAKGKFAASILNNNIYVIGGAAGDGTKITDRVQVFNPYANTWSETLPLPVINYYSGLYSTGRSDFNAVTFNNRIYIIGGIVWDHPSNKSVLYALNRIDVLRNTSTLP